MSKPRGSIDVICGPMFSGKTEELIRRLRRLEYGGKKYLIFKPKMDTRYSEDEVVSHNKTALTAIPVERAKDILEHVALSENIDTVAIDEAQFFTKSNSRENRPNLVDVCFKLKRKGIKVILNGLDMDYNGKPFGPMPDLMAISNRVLKLTAVCMKKDCGKEAEMTLRFSSSEEILNDDGNVIELGEKDKYEARCFMHWSAEDNLKIE